MLTGIHHVTAISGDAQANVDFYSGVLGLRLVKLTVNFDDPGTYHLYYGDGKGSPGTLITFFPYTDGYEGRVGNGQATSVSYAIPENSLDYWQARLKELKVPVEGTYEQFGNKVVALRDPDGMLIELVGVSGTVEHQWKDSPVPAEHAILGIHSVALSVEQQDKTAQLLTETMGYRLSDQKDNRYRYLIGEGNWSQVIDVLAQPDGTRGRIAKGSIHHVAFRTPDDANQEQWHKTLNDLGYQVSPVMDRNYFHSIYFREPGHVLFEIATDPPGMDVDETEETLGTSLKLPTQYESFRDRIEAVLPKLKLPVKS